jgi:hypothetical protein
LLSFSHLTEDTIPDATNEHFASALESLVNHSVKHVDLGDNIHASAPKYHIGGLMMVRLGLRGTDEKCFGSMHPVC